MYRAVKIRLYPTPEQATQLNQVMGCSRWWYNYALNLCLTTYQETGKGLGRGPLNSYLPKLKKQEETKWLASCYSQVLQATTLNLTRAFTNFFDKRTKFPKFKSYHGRQSATYPQNVKIVNSSLSIPKIGLVKAKIHKVFDGELKSVTISKSPAGDYYASLLFDTKEVEPTKITEGKIIGVDLGLKDFAITFDGEKCSKYSNPKHLTKHEKNLAGKQAKLARKQKGSQNREKAKKIVAKVYARISNARQDYLHKLSRKIVNDYQVVIVENLNIKGMVRNHKLAKAISDVGWGTFVNFLDYKIKLKGGVLVEIDRWFPSSKTCSNCLEQLESLTLDVREWTCPNCGTQHDRDENASKNIRAEGLRQLWVSGIGTSASGGEVSRKGGRNPIFTHTPMKLEAPSSGEAG